MKFFGTTGAVADAVGWGGTGPDVLPMGPWCGFGAPTIWGFLLANGLLFSWIFAAASVSWVILLLLFPVGVVLGCLNGG